MDRQTDGRTDGWTNGRAKPLIVASPRLKKSTPIGVLRLDEQRNQSTKSVNTLRAAHIKTRPDTRLPQSRASGQGPYLRSLHHLGMSSEAKDRKKTKKVKCDGPTDRPTDRWTDGPTKWGVESPTTRLKTLKKNLYSQCQLLVCWSVGPPGQLG